MKATMKVVAFSLCLLMPRRGYKQVPFGFALGRLFEPRPSWS